MRTLIGNMYMCGQQRVPGNKKNPSQSWGQCTSPNRNLQAISFHPGYTASIASLASSKDGYLSG